MSYLTSALGQGQGRPTSRAGRPPVLIAVMITAALMDMLDVTIVNVALPTIRRRLHAGPSELEWVVAGYALAFAATLVLWGRVGDVFGRRRVFLVAVAVFGLASLGAGLSQTSAELIAARIVGGAAAGALVPQVLATFRASLDDKTRLTAFGVYGVIAGLAAAVGVILGGILTQYSLFGLSWRTVFLVNVPVCLIVLAAATLYVPESRAAGNRLDLPGGIVLAASLAAVVYPLLEGQSLGWPAWSFALLAAGVLGVVALAAIEHRRERRGVTTLLQTGQFRYRAFSAGIAAQGLFGLGLQGFSFTFILWVQFGHGFSPLKAGLTLVAFSAGAVLTAPQAGQLAARLGNRVLITGGILLAAGTLVVAIPAWSDATTASPWPLLAGLAVAGAGLGLLVVPLVNVVLAAVPAGSAGGASGTFSTAQQLGGALGIAILGTIFFAHTGAHLNHAFAITAPVAAGAYSLAALLCLALPKTAVKDEDVIAAG
jgi:EmrB/QacA subfamily drug resistance transporter